MCGQDRQARRPATGEGRKTIAMEGSHLGQRRLRVGEQRVFFYGTLTKLEGFPPPSCCIQDVCLVHACAMNEPMHGNEPTNRGRPPICAQANVRCHPRAGRGRSTLTRWGRPPWLLSAATLVESVRKRSPTPTDGRTELRESDHTWKVRCSRQKVGSKAEVGLKSGYSIVVRG